MKLNYQKIKLITTLILIGMSIFLFFSFNSYWTYGNIDQSEIINNTVAKLNAQNILGFIGAKVSYTFINLLGISAYLIISFIIFLTIKIVFKAKKINILNTLIQHLFLIIWISLFCSLLNNVTLGGVIGIVMTTSLLPLIGYFGITLTLAISSLMFCILLFNIKIEYVGKLILSIRENLKLFTKPIEILNKNKEISQSKNHQNINTESPHTVKDTLQDHAEKQSQTII